MTDDNSLFYRMLHNHHRGQIGEAAKKIAEIKAEREKRMGSDLLMGCGCHFVDGIAVNLCSLAVLRDGALLHVSEPVARAEAELTLTAFDKRFLCELKVKA